MGQTKGAYNAEHPAGTRVRVVSHTQLQEFKRTWRLHHPLVDDQLAYASVEGVVVSVGFYHGGDELYSIDNAPGIWHEVCLERVALIAES
jgi:hypothetical protein